MYDIVHKELSAAELMSICKLLLSQFMVSFGVLNHHLQEGRLLQFLLQSKFSTSYSSHIWRSGWFNSVAASNPDGSYKVSSYVLLIRLDGYSMQLSCSLFCLGTLYISSNCSFTSLFLYGIVYH